MNISLQVEVQREELLKMFIVSVIMKYIRSSSMVAFKREQHVSRS